MTYYGMDVQALIWGALLGAIGIIGFSAALFWSSRQLRESWFWGVARVNVGKLVLLSIVVMKSMIVFPLAYVVDADGKPLYSWRVVILHRS